MESRPSVNLQNILETTCTKGILMKLVLDISPTISKKGNEFQVSSKSNVASVANILKNSASHLPHKIDTGPSNWGQSYLNYGRNGIHIQIFVIASSHKRLVVLIREFTVLISTCRWISTKSKASDFQFIASSAIYKNVLPNNQMY